MQSLDAESQHRSDRPTPPVYNRTARRKAAVFCAMNLTDIFRSYVPLRWQRTTPNEPLSMVMLQRKAHFFGAEELRLAAERAWHTSFTGEDEDSMHCVVQRGKITLMKVGPHMLNFFCYPAPYVENPKETVDWLPRPGQREAWVNHSACFGVDYLNGDVSVQLGYSVLSKLVAEMLDSEASSQMMRLFIWSCRNLRPSVNLA
jgi:hypothetical protein